MYRHRILIVDDDKLLQKPLKQILADKYDVLPQGVARRRLGLLRKSLSISYFWIFRLPG